MILTLWNVQVTLVADLHWCTHFSHVDIRSQVPTQTAEEEQCHIDDKLLSATAATPDSTKTMTQPVDCKPLTSVPLQLPTQNSFITHRTVTPVLPDTMKTSDSLYEHSERESIPRKEQANELFSPMSTQFLVPLDYEAIFSGRQTLRVSETPQLPFSEDVSPVSVFSDSLSAHVLTEASTMEESDDPKLIPQNFSQVHSEYEKLIPKIESDPNDLLMDHCKADSPQRSDSELEFFDCRQTFSDSEPEDGKLELHFNYHISEPPSPMPGIGPDDSFLKGSPQDAAHPYLQVEDYKHLSSGGEGFCDFPYDSEFQTEVDLPLCEELPSRDQAGYYDDDDFLGRVRG